MTSPVERELHRDVCAALPTPSDRDLSDIVEGAPTLDPVRVDVVFDPAPGMRF